MSSNIRIVKTCEYCKNEFIAKTTVTKCCSDDCAKRNYKKHIREEKITTVIFESNHQTVEAHCHINLFPQNHNIQLDNLREWVSVRDLSYVLSVSERTLFRTIKDQAFPKLKVGRRLLFNRQQVLCVNGVFCRLESSDEFKMYGENCLKPGD